MTQHDDDIRLRHMLDHAREAVDLLQGRKRADLDTDRQLNLALVRLLEIIGEAAVRVTADTRDAIPTLPWSEVVGLRNRVIHGYDSVDFDIVWETVRSDLPQMIQALDERLGSRSTES